MSNKKDLYTQILPRLIGTLISLMVLLPNPSRANVLLGIIRDPENTDEWNQIITRIRAIGISYEPIDLTQINTLADLSGVKVIFLPNIETLTQTQVQILEEWVKQGGKLIASGQVGRRSQPGVRQQLRSLLGSYWAFPLSQPTTPEPKYRCLDIACKESTSWAPKANNQGKVAGGILIPAGLNSTTAATWKGSSGSSAVVITPQATYLGWHWGNSASATLDSVWLQATLNRYQSEPQFTARNNNPLTTGNNSQTLPTTNNSNPLKIRPRTSPSPIPNNENLNIVGVQPRTTSVNTPENSTTNQLATEAQNSTPDQDNIWLRSQQQNINTQQQPENYTQPTETNLSLNNNSVSEATTTPQNNNVWQRFREQTDQQNQQPETVREQNTPVSSTANPTLETTNNNRGGSLGSRFPQQRNQQNQKTDTVSNNDFPVNSSDNPTPETTNNRENIWNRSRQETKTTTSSSRRNLSPYQEYKYQTPKQTVPQNQHLLV